MTDFIVPISHDRGEFGLAILCSSFLYLLIILCALAIAFSRDSMSASSLKMSVLSSSALVMEFAVVSGCDGNGCVDGDLRGSIVGVRFMANGDGVGIFVGAVGDDMTVIAGFGLFCFGANVNDNGCDVVLFLKPWLYFLVGGGHGSSNCRRRPM